MPTDQIQMDLPGQETAAGILGLRRSCRRAVNLSLEREVNSYLDDMEEGSGTLAYWQVHSNFHEYIYYCNFLYPGKSSTLPYNLRTCNGCLADSRLIRPL